MWIRYSIDSKKKRQSPITLASTQNIQNRTAHAQKNKQAHMHEYVLTLQKSKLSQECLKIAMNHTPGKTHIRIPRRETISLIFPKEKQTKHQVQNIRQELSYQSLYSQTPSYLLQIFQQLIGLKLIDLCVIFQFNAPKPKGVLKLNLDISFPAYLMNQSLKFSCTIPTNCYIMDMDSRMTSY